MRRLVRILSVVWLPLAMAPLAGCQSAARTPLPTREAIESSAAGILSGFDELAGCPQLTAGAEALYQVDIFRDNQPETSFLQVRLVQPSLEGVERVRVNPAEDVKPGPKDRIVRDTEKESYELKPHPWSLQGKLDRADTGEKEHKSKTYWAFANSALAWVALYDAQGQLLRSRFLLVPDSCLTGGFYKPVLFGKDLTKMGLLSEQEADQIYPAALEACLGLQTLSMIVISTPLLKPIASEFIPFSVKLAAIFGQLRLQIGMHDAGLSSDSIEGVPTAYTDNSCMMTFILQANGRQIVRSKLRAMKPSSPMNASAGVLEMEGESLSDPSRRFRIRLIAARRAKKADCMLSQRSSLDDRTANLAQ